VSCLPRDQLGERFASAIEQGDVDTLVKLVMQSAQEQEQG
jgi:hypothetical protein